MFGPNFGEELIAAGLGDKVAGFREDGSIIGRQSLTKADDKKLQAVIDAHDPDAKVKRRVGEFREFMALFTEEEQLALASASLSDVRVKLWYDKAMGGASFSLDNAETALGIGFMVQMGLLTESRGAEILAADFDA